jgi:hypothetical protein
MERPASGGKYTSPGHVLCLMFYVILLAIYVFAFIGRLEKASCC